MTVTELFDEFDALEDWEERCEFLIDMGFDLPEMLQESKTEENRVHGCQSNVWLIAEIGDSNPTRITYSADSDAMIVKGLIAVLLAVYSGKTPQEVLDADIKTIFSRLGLDRHLSPARRNGLNGMVERIRSIARNTA